MAELRKIWQDAKKESERNFTIAYRALVAQLDAETEAPDARKKAALIQSALKKIGLDEGPKYAAYFDFDSGFGPELDKMEQMAENNAAIAARIEKLTLDDAFKNGKLKSVFKEYCESEYCTENFEFYDSGHRLATERIHERFMAKDAEMLLNVPAALSAPWHKSAESGDWRAARALIPKIREEIKSLIREDTYKRFKQSSKLLPDIIKALGAKEAEMDLQAMEIERTARNYAQKVQEYAKRCKDLKPDFWTPLATALTAVMREVEALRKGNKLAA